MKYEAPEMFELGDAEELTQAMLCGLVMDADGFPRFKCRPRTEAPEVIEEAEPNAE
jgi:hypothetical protein